MIVATALLGVAAFSFYQLYKHNAEEVEQEELFEEIAKIVKKPKPKQEEDTPPAVDTDDEDILDEYRDLYLQNTDMIGWIEIKDTVINYPVMYTPHSPNYYLKRNFNKSYSALGVPYIQENCTPAESDNLIIYGHHIRGGKMFGALEQYKSKSFYENHKIINFNLLTKQSDYEIIAVFKTITYSKNGFRYHDFVNAEDETSFNAYVDKCKELSLYETGVTAKYGDKLITLSTCEYSAKDSRLVVVAKKVT